MGGLSALVSRLSVTKKLVAIYLMDLLVTASIVVSFVNDKKAQIDFSGEELEGTAIFAPARDYYAAVLDELRTASGDRQAVTLAFERTDRARLDHGGAMGVEAQWTALSAAEQDFLAAGTDTDRAVRFAPLQDRLDDFLAEVGDKSNLILDPDLDSYYAMDITVVHMPAALRLIHQLEVTAGTDQSAETRLVALSSLAAELQRVSAEITRSLEAGGAGNPDGTFRPALAAPAARFKAAIEDLEAKVGTPQQVAEAAHAATAASFAFWTATSRELDALLAARVHGLYLATALKLGITLILALAVLYAVTFIGRQITRPVRELVAVAGTAGGGDRRRALWRSGDEFGSLVDTFNGMLDRLEEEARRREEITAAARAAAAQRDLLDAIALPVLVLSLDGVRLLHANQAAKAGFGGRLERLAFLDPSQAARLVSRLAVETQLDQLEIDAVDAAGERIPLVLSGRRIAYHGEQASLLGLTPVTELKRVAKALSEAKDEAEVTTARLQATSEVLMSSLHYASRIQRSIFPDERLVEQFDQDLAVSVEQRDIVGGDWNWIGRFPDGDLVFLCDCTGHGVPGALMTMLVATSFRQIVEDSPTRSPAEILMALHRQVRSALMREGGSMTDDGLDALCVFIERGTGFVRVAGVRQSLLIADASGGIREIRGDRTSIGYPSLPETVEVAEHRVPVLPGDLLYLYTDGLVDQVGGDDRRLFGRRRLASAIEEVRHEAPAEQLRRLRDRLAEYRGTQSMRDDASLMIFRMSGDTAAAATDPGLRRAG